VLQRPVFLVQDAIRSAENKGTADSIVLCTESALAFVTARGPSNLISEQAKALSMRIPVHRETNTIRMQIQPLYADTLGDTAQDSLPLLRTTSSPSVV